MARSFRLTAWAILLGAATLFYAAPVWAQMGGTRAYVEYYSGWCQPCGAGDWDYHCPCRILPPIIIS